MFRFLTGFPGQWERVELQGKVAIVTGASSGIGREVARRLAEAGMHVVGCARNEGRLVEVGQELGIEMVRCDVRVRKDRKRLVSQVLERHGRIDVLVNNAGLGWTGLVEEMGAEDVESLWETNVLGPVDLTRRVLPSMLERGEGTVVMISSASAFFSFPPLSVYAATKRAVDAFVEGLRREVGLRGVQVHTINPGPVRTEWLVRSRGYEPGEGAPEERFSPGVPTSWVADAVLRSLSRPYARSVSVPRILGVSRVLQLQPLRLALDVSLGLSAKLLASKGRKAALERIPPGEDPGPKPRER